MTIYGRLAQSAMKDERRIVGLMSGTSVDGIDAVVVRIGGSGCHSTVAVEAFITYPFDEDLRARVLALSHGDTHADEVSRVLRRRMGKDGEVGHGIGNAEEVSRVNFLLGAAFGNAVQAALDAASLRADSVDVIASHGQTVSHTAPYATLQIGESSVLTNRFGVPVISDFRTADVAAGGQGAPLVPYADWCLLTHPTKSRAIQNIGGIGNVTYLPAGARPEQVLGFDTGPGNMLIDRAAQWATNSELAFDRDGRLASSGRIHYSLLDSLLEHKFLEKSPPKSAGREEFGEAFFEYVLKQGTTRAGETNRDTLVTTLTAFTALSIADAYDRFLPAMPNEIILGGGGARNPTLVRMLRDKLRPIPILTHEDVGMNSDSKEAVAFALLANETLLGRTSNLPSVTGAKKPVIQGKLTLPPPA